MQQQRESDTTPTALDGYLCNSSAVLAQLIRNEESGNHYGQGRPSGGNVNQEYLSPNAHHSQLAQGVHEHTHQSQMVQHHEHRQSQILQHSEHQHQAQHHDHRHGHSGDSEVGVVSDLNGAVNMHLVDEGVDTSAENVLPPGYGTVGEQDDSGASHLYDGHHYVDNNANMSRNSQQLNQSGGGYQMHSYGAMAHHQLQQQQQEYMFEGVDPSRYVMPAENAASAAAAHAAAIHPYRQHQQMQEMQNSLAQTSQDGRMSAYGHMGEANPRTFSSDLLMSHKAIAFLAGPRERIHVFGNPVEFCPRCQAEGCGNVSWRPHRHIGELKVRYICERHFDDLESVHHFDIPLCPLCGQVLYLYEFNAMLGVGSARRLHKYVLKCGSRHVLPLLDLFCQTKKCGERCNSNFKLQWSYGTMVKRCESQKNRDHDLWWVRYKNEWKQRRTIIRYKKDFLRHLADVQRAVLLGLGTEGEAPPDPKFILGPTYDTVLPSVGGAPTSPKIKKRRVERAQLQNDEFSLASVIKRQRTDESESEYGCSHMTVNSAVDPCFLCFSNMQTEGIE